jgi:hypothetical protein
LRADNTTLLDIVFMLISFLHPPCIPDIHDFQQIVLLRSPRLDLQRSHPDSSSEDEADWDYEQTFESPSLPDSMSETGDEARLGHLSTADYTLSVTSNFFSKTSPNKLKSVFRLAKQSPSQIKYGAQLWTAWRPGEIRNQYMVVDDTSQLPKCLVLFPSDTTHEDTSTGATCQAPIVIPIEFAKIDPGSKENKVNIVPNGDSLRTWPCIQRTLPDYLENRDFIGGGFPAISLDPKQFHCQSSFLKEHEEWGFLMKAAKIEIEGLNKGESALKMLGQIHWK